MKRILYLILIAIFTLLAQVSANANLLVYINLKKHTYFKNEDIRVHIRVKNISEKTQIFTIYDYKKSRKSTFTTFQPQVYDMFGRKAEVIVPYKILKKSLETTLKKLHARKIAIAPNEEMVHSINLKQLYKLIPEKEYRLKSYFIPDFSKKHLIISSNELHFKIKNESSSATLSGVSQKIKRYVPKRKLTPKEVILLALQAEKHRMPFAKYLNIQRFIYSYPKYYHIYQKARYQHKVQIERDFITFLYRDRYDYILDFNIIKEHIKNSRTAYVDVIVDRFGAKRTHRYRYRYTLNRKNKYEPFWLITDLDAYVLKGVKR